MKIPFIPDPYQIIAEVGALAVAVVLVFSTGWHYGAKGPTRELVEYKASQVALVREKEAGWARERATLAVDEFRRMEHAQSTFDGLRARARGLARTDVVLGRAAVGVLTDASRAANAAGIEPLRDEPPAAVPATPDAESGSQGSQGAGDPGLVFTQADIVGAWVAAADAYSDVLGKLNACIKEYNVLRE